MLNFRFAEKKDIGLILNFIRDLAEYENLLDTVKTTEEFLTEWVFRLNKAEIFFAELDGIPIGFALYYYNISTFSASVGLFLEDLFVLPEYRHRGYGKAILRHLSMLAIEKGCTKLEWQVLEWNEPSIRFYKSIGGLHKNGWITYQLTEENLINFIEK